MNIHFVVALILKLIIYKFYLLIFKIIMEDNKKRAAFKKTNSVAHLESLEQPQLNKTMGFKRQLSNRGDLS